MKKKIFLDSETTGLDPKTGQIVEIAIVDETGRCLLSTRYNLDCTLQLQTDKEIDAALEYNKLTREELSLYRPIDKFDLSTIEAILTSAEVAIGHNVSFDKSFLESTSERVLGYNCFEAVKWECTMDMLAKAKGIKSGRVKLPCMQLSAIAHSALSDAQNARLLYQSLDTTKELSPEWNW
jgi:DNA polymerase III epsilon subunit-like protein